MKKKKLSGIALLTSLTALIVVMLMIMSAGQEVAAFYVKLSIVMMALTIFSAGYYLIDIFTPDASAQIKKIILGLGVLTVVVSILVGFDIIPFEANYNWMIVLGLIFVLLVQLQLLSWGKRVKQIVRFSALIVILCDAFLIFFFVAKWQNYQFELWLNLAAALSVLLTLIGMIFNRTKTEGNSEAAV